MSKILFYILIVMLPLGTRKIFFTDQSFFYGFHIFYHDFHVYLTDIVFFGLMLSWIVPPLLLPLIKGEIKEGVFHMKRLTNVIKNDVIYRVLILFWLILAVSTILSREIWFGFYGFLKISEFFLIFAYVRENFEFSPARLRKDEVVAGGREMLSKNSVILELRRFGRSDRISRDPIAPSGLQDDKNTSIFVIFWLILATFSCQAVIGIVQYLSQKSLGLKILGEEFLRPGIDGIAEFASNGVVSEWIWQIFPYFEPFSRLPTGQAGEILNIRAYGTLPHPNILAGGLVVAIIVNLYLLYQTNFSREKLKTPVLSFSLIVLTTALTLTFSRVAWLVALLSILAWFVFILWKIGRPHMKAMPIGNAQKHDRDYFPGRLALIAGVLLLSLGLNLALFGGQIGDRVTPSFNSSPLEEEEGWGGESFKDRILFNNLSIEMIAQNPFTGVGLRNFIVELDNHNSGKRLLPYQHQPVHNVYLLIAAEAGLAAIVVFGILLFYIVRRGFKNSKNPVLRYSLLVACFALLFIGLFDHYIWTIQQGALIFWVTLGLLSAKSP